MTFLKNLKQMSFVKWLDTLMELKKLGGKYPESLNKYMTTDKHSFGHGSGKFYLDDVNCKGNEVSILQCEHRGWGVVNGCYDGHRYGSHKHEWAAVTCLV